VDAITDLIPDAHRNSVEVVSPNLGEATTTESVPVLLNGEDKA